MSVETCRGFVWRRRSLRAWGVGLRWRGAGGEILGTQARCGAYPAYQRWDDAAAEAARWAEDATRTA